MTAAVAERKPIYVESTQLSAIVIANSTRPSGEPTTLKDRVMVEFDKLCADPESMLNEKLGGKDNVRTLRVMQDPNFRGDAHPYQIIFVLKTPVEELEKIRRKAQEKVEMERMRQERMKLLQNTKAPPQVQKLIGPCSDCGAVHSWYTFRLPRTGDPVATCISEPCQGKKQVSLLHALSTVKLEEVLKIDPAFRSRERKGKRPEKQPFKKKPEFRSQAEKRRFEANTRRK